VRSFSIFPTAVAISDGRPFQELPLFVVDLEGRAQINDVSNTPFVRPDIKEALNGLKFVREKNYPIRGTADPRLPSTTAVSSQ
jgi:hypothetical protein